MICGHGNKTDEYCSRCVALALSKAERDRAVLLEALKALLPNPEYTGELTVEQGFACGRHYLNVMGAAIVIEGDVCRDFEFGKNWRPADFKAIEKRLTDHINKALKAIGELG